MFGDDLFRTDREIHREILREKQVWRDLNQNGVSEANELFSLAQLGIAAINLSGHVASVNLGNGNTQTVSTTYVKTDGSEEAAGNVIGEGNAGNLDLASNPFYREFEDKILLSEAVAQLPDMQGSGAVRDLREAAQLSPELQSRLQALVDTGATLDRASYRARIVELVSAWAATAEFKGSVELAEEQHFGLQYLAPDAEKDKNEATFVTTQTPSSGPGLVSNAIHPVDAQLQEWVDLLEIFNGVPFIEKFGEDKDGRKTATTEGGATFVTDKPEPKPVQGNGVFSVPTLRVTLPQTQYDLIEKSYETLIDSVADALLLYTRLKPYVDAITLEITEDGLRFGTENM